MREEIARRIAGYPGAGDGVLVAFSGGVDSAVILALAKQTCGNTHAAYFSTMLHPAGEGGEAAALAGALGVAFHVLEVDELADAGIENNPPDRCYRCKRLLFTRLRALADSLGIAVLLDGTNADDREEFRPGLRALRELGIRSPLMELAVRKSRVRAMAEELGLAVSRKPSSPCLATRVEYGAPLLREQLENIGRAEGLLKTMGFAEVRVRVHCGMARVEVPAGAIPLAARRHAEISAALEKLGFVYVTLDLHGLQSGSMDRALTPAQKRAALGDGID